MTTEEPVSTREPTSRVRGADLAHLVEETRTLAAGGGGVTPPGVAPVLPHAAARRSFSFSRLSGMLSQRHVSEGQRADDEVPAMPLLDPRGLGTLVHEVLERLPLATAEPSAVLALCEFLAPLHLPEHAVEASGVAAEMVLRFVQSPRVAEMNAAACLLREVEFLLPGHLISPALQGRYLEGTIDCLYQDATGGWHLVDYKSNRATAAEVPSAAAPYAPQMFVYGLACEHSLGVRPVESVVHFLRPGVESAFAWSDAERLALIAEIEQAVDTLCQPAAPAGIAIAGI